MQYIVKRVRTFQRAARIWEYLSPHKDLFDSWAYRAQYYLYFPYPLYFYTAYYENRPAALLPLQWNEETKALEFFGGKRFSYNSVFVLPGHDEAVQALFEHVKKRTALDYLREPLDTLPQAQSRVFQYRLQLASFQSYEDYLETCWHGKHRKQIRRNVRQIEEAGAQVSAGSVADLDLLMQFNMDRFGDRSNFTIPHRKDYLKNLMNDYDVKLFTITLNGVKKAVSYSIFYKGGYYGITSGADTSVPFLRKYMMLMKIDEAIKCGAHFYDAGRRDFGWKEQFKFEKHTFYTWNGIPSLLYRKKEIDQIPVEVHTKSL